MSFEIFKTSDRPSIPNPRVYTKEEASTGRSPLVFFPEKFA